MDTISIAVKTADRRPNKNYLSKTLTALVMSGFPIRGSRIHVVDSCGSDWLAAELKEWAPNSILRIHHDRDYTLHQNAARAIRIAAGDGADWALVLEDDLDFCADFVGSVLRWLSEHESGDRRMYAFGANYVQIKDAVVKHRTAWNYPVGSFYGAQALAWRADDAQRLAEWLGPDPHYDGVRNHGHDLLLQRWGRENGLRFFLASAPSFVQHIGEASGIGNRFFRFGSWPGREWKYRGRFA